MMDRSTLRHVVERPLGRSLDESDYGRYPDLLQLPPRIVDEAKKLVGVARIAYLQFHVGDAWRSEYVNFVEEVLDRGTDPVVWGQGRVLFAKPRVDEFLRDGIASIRRLLGDRTPTRWFRLRPRARSEDAGAIAVLRPELDYSYEPPECVQASPWSFVVYLEPAVDVGIAARRWMALKMALALSHWKRPDDATSAEAWMPRLLAKLQTAPGAPSVALEDVCADAWVSAKGVAREWAELPPDPDAIPGFRGPDEWYACADTE